MWESLKEHRALAIVLLLVAGVATVTAVTYRPESPAPQTIAATQLPKPVGDVEPGGGAPEGVQDKAGEPVIAAAPAAQAPAISTPQPTVPAPLATQPKAEDPETPEPQNTVVVAAAPDPKAPAAVTPKLSEPTTEEIPESRAQAEPVVAAPAEVPNDLTQAEDALRIGQIAQATKLDLKATESATAQLSSSVPQAKKIAASAPAQPPLDIAETTPKALRAPQVQAETDIAAQSPAEGSLVATVAIDDRYKPRFDLVRVEPDGSAVVAGKAPAGAVVTILSDGIELGQATATSRGEFVAFINTVPSQEVQTLELKAEVVGEPAVVSDETVLLLAKTETNDLSLPELESTPQIPTVVKATSEGVSVVQSPDLAVLDEVSLDTIGYDAEGEVVLTGRGTPGQRVFIYADGNPIGANAISDRGSWRMVMVDLTAGRYVLRVDEVDPDGKVLSRVESPFQRVFPEDELKTAGLTRSNVVVQPGSNLWTIARIRYGSGFKYTQIYQANRDRIRDPDLIYPGQIFDLPETE